jgi:hypothetical protein
MVAFELAQFHEKIGANIEAVRWYTAAAERFRRAQWKQKAEEALTRLGAPIPVAPAAASVSESGAEPATRLKDKFPKPPANWTVVSKNQFSNNRKKYQPLRQSPPRLSQAIAANVAAAEAGGAGTKARALPLL